MRVSKEGPKAARAHKVLVVDDDITARMISRHIR